MPPGPGTASIFAGGGVPKDLAADLGRLFAEFAPAGPEP